MQYPPSILADLASMLLSNITMHASACATLVDLKIPVVESKSSDQLFYPLDSRSGSSPPPNPYPTGETKEVLALPLLVQAFVQSAKTSEPPESRTRKADLHFLSSVFANITMVCVSKF